MRSKYNILSVLLVCCTVLVNAQIKKAEVPRSYIAYQTPTKIVVDGDENDASWSKVAWSNPFIDIEGVKSPTYKTQVKMLWDKEYFYIIAKIEEPHVWADITKRDAIIFYNNDFEVFIDPDGDTHNYYELEINALNTAWDLFINKPYRDSNVVLNDWDLNGLKSAVKVNGTINDSSDVDKGWVLEMAIPWAAYKSSYFQKNVPVDKFWRVNFSRVNWNHSITNGKYSRKKGSNGKYLHEYNWVWSPQGKISMHMPEKWGYVYFSSKKPGKKDHFEISKDEKLKHAMYVLFGIEKKNTKRKKMSVSYLKTTVEGKEIKVKLESHSTGWNLITKSPFSNKTFIITEDGKFIQKK